MNTKALVILAACIFSSGSALACKDFSGKYKQKSGRDVTIIKQVACNTIEISNKYTEVNNVRLSLPINGSLHKLGDDAKWSAQFKGNLLLVKQISELPIYDQSGKAKGYEQSVHTVSYQLTVGNDLQLTHFQGETQLGKPYHLVRQ